jgi:F0F1-type ATP synthase assembly protein I
LLEGIASGMFLGEFIDRYSRTTPLFVISTGDDVLITILQALNWFLRTRIEFWKIGTLFIWHDLLSCASVN